MTKYVENVNEYIKKMKIKQTFISLKSGIEISKLSRILTGTQDVTATDMERISTALGKRIEYFLDEDFKVTNSGIVTEVAFYAGEPGSEQERFALKLIDLIENVDEVFGAKSRFMDAILEGTDEV